MVKNSLTIRKILLLPLVVVTLALLSVLGFIGCSNNGLSENSLINMGYTIAVNYDYNGGNVRGASSARIRLMPNSPIPKPKQGSGSTILIPGRPGYSFRYFCVAETDEDGELRKDENGDLIPGKIWDFDNDRVGEGSYEITLIAQWWQNYRIQLHYGTDYSEETSIDVTRDIDGEPIAVPQASFNVFAGEEADYKIAAYYRDSEEQERMDITESYKFEKHEFEASSDGITIEVWAKSVPVAFNVVNKAADFTKFEYSRSSDIYLNADIDMNDLYDKTTLEFNFNDILAFGGKFYGNGHTIRNYRQTYTPLGTFDNKLGIFKTIDEGADIRDVTFENVSLTLNLSNPKMQEYTIGMIAGLIRSGATLTNVSVSGTLEYKATAGYDLNRITVGDMFGEKQSDVTLTNVTLPHLTTVNTDVIYAQGTDGANYAVYAQFTHSDDGIVLKEVYGIATVAEDSSMSAINIRNTVKTDEFTYTLSTARKSYTVAVTKVDDNTFTAAVTVADR